MKNNNKFRLDVWGAITLGTIALYALFLLYPMAYLIRQSVLDPDTGGFTLAYFTKFFSKRYPDQQLQGVHHSDGALHLHWHPTGIPVYDL
mgnify:CR=1 FL=1